jgi:L-2,4-diaminobutyric acid acetyltransferase
MTKTDQLQPTTDSRSQRAVLRRPRASDGSTLWRMARDSGSLDLNSPYAYLLWADQFSATSVIAEVDGEPAGFITGHLVPGREHVLFIWQVAVAPSFRGLGLAGRMLDELIEQSPAITAVEATVTPSNVPSRRLFEALARRHDCACTESPHFSSDHFPRAGHEPEPMLHIGPLGSQQ